MTDQYLKVTVCWHAVGGVSFSILLSDGVVKYISCLFVDFSFSFRELTKGRDGGKAELSPARIDRRLLQIVVRRDHVFQDSYLQVLVMALLS